MRKPDTCAPCPMYQEGEGFVPDERVEGARVFILMQNPGEEEERLGAPAVGKTGQLMNDQFLPAAGLHRQDVCVGNVLRCRWQHTNKLPPEGVLKPAIEHCRQYLVIPQSIELLVAQGALAWRALGQVSTISEWRGYVGPNLV